MTKEINIMLSVTVKNGFFKHDANFGQVLVDQAAPGRGGHVQVIGLTEETLEFGDVATEGYLILRNLDPENFVEYGPQVGTGSAELCCTLKAGEPAVLRLKPGSVWRAKADTAPVKLDVCLLEN